MGLSVTDSGGYRVTSFSSTDLYASCVESPIFTYGSAPLAAVLAAGVEYTVCVATYAAASPPDAFTLSVTCDGGVSPLSELGVWGSAALLAQHMTEDASEVTRRSNALAAMAASANGTRDDMSQAHAMVDAQVAQCRAAGTLFCDEWTTAAVAKNTINGCPVVWLRLSELAPRPAVVVGGFSHEDVLQGQIGDCYLHSSLSLLADRKSTLGGASSLLASPLDDVFTSTSINPEGVYCVRFWIGETWVNVMIDDRIPCDPDAYRVLPRGGNWAGKPAPSQGHWGHPFGATSRDPREFWVCLLEKAWAKVSGGYDQITGGNLAEATLALVPHTIGRAFPLDGDAATPHPSMDGVWCDLLQLTGKGWPCAVSSSQLPASAPSKGSELLESGIVRGKNSSHAYACLRVIEVPTCVSNSGRPLRLMQLRNPWGRTEWDGAYSNSDSARWTPALCAYTGYFPSHDNTGVFWMEFSDVATRFCLVEVLCLTKLVGDGGLWHKCSGSGRWTGSIETLSANTYADCAQFQVIPAQSGRCTVVLSQERLIASPRKGPFASLAVVAFSESRSEPISLPLEAATFVGLHRVAETETVITDSSEVYSLELPFVAGESLVIVPLYFGVLYATVRRFTIAVLAETPFIMNGVE